MSEIIYDMFAFYFALLGVIVYLPMSIKSLEENEIIETIKNVIFALIFVAGCGYSLGDILNRILII